MSAERTPPTCPGPADTPHGAAWLISKAALSKHQGDQRREWIGWWSAQTANGLRRGAAGGGWLSPCAAFMHEDDYHAVVAATAQLQAALRLPDRAGYRPNERHHGWGPAVAHLPGPRTGCDDGRKPPGSPDKVRERWLLRHTSIEHPAVADDLLRIGADFIWAVPVQGLELPSVTSACQDPC